MLKQAENIVKIEGILSETKLEYGSYVNFEERFYTCPFCGEPVYEDDWSEVDLGNFLCPICEDEDEY